MNRETMRENWPSNHQFAADEIFIDNVTVDHKAMIRIETDEGADKPVIINSEIPETWGALVFLIGIVWRIRGTIFS